MPESINQSQQKIIQLGAVFTTCIRAAAAENFNPALADPRGNITCVGNSYDLELPVIGDFNPNGLTMQQLCAKPQYGGGLPGQHVGGWCEHWLLEEGPFPRPPLNMAFDVSPAAIVNPLLANPRVFLACTYRCFCSYVVRPNSAQPRISHVANQYGRTFQAESNQTHEIMEEVDDVFETSWVQASRSWFNAWHRIVDPYFTRPVSWPENLPRRVQLTGLLNVEPPEPWRGSSGETQVHAARVAIRNQSSIPTPSIPVTSQVAFQSFSLDVSHHVTNDIECRGSVPHFPLPGPYDKSAFANLREFCAVQMGGGARSKKRAVTDAYHVFRAANAGGYCHTGIDPTTSDLTRTVWFSDEFTPRLEWTWSGNFLASVAIRTYCWRRCACEYRPTKENLTTSVFGLSVWPLLENIYVAEAPDGSMTLHNLISQLSLMQILPSQRPATRLGAAAPAAGTCGIDRKQFCEISWPADILGPDIPRAPPNSSQVVKPAAAAHPSRNFTECGRYFSRHLDCSKPGTGDASDGNDCFCGIPSQEDGKRLGLDILAPVPVCLVLAHLAIEGLSGRDVERR
ncbi:MAG: hypothetical protein Q9192_003547 [Flavoplaca navasiana]